MTQTEIPFEKNLKRAYWREHICGKGRDKKELKNLVLMRPMLDERYWGGKCLSCQKDVIEKKFLS